MYRIKNYVFQKTKSSIFAIFRIQHEHSGQRIRKWTLKHYTFMMDQTLIINCNQCMSKVKTLSNLDYPLAPSGSHIQSNRSCNKSHQRNSVSIRKDWICSYHFFLAHVLKSFWSWWMWWLKLWSDHMMWIPTQSQVTGTRILQIFDVLCRDDWRWKVALVFAFRQ